VFTAIHAALHPERVASLALLATPIDLETGPLSTVELWARRLKVDPARLAGWDGLVPGHLVRSLLTLANPVQLTLAKWYELLDVSHDPNLVRGFFQGQRWACDTPPIAGKLFAEVMHKIYQRNELARGSLAIRRAEARLSAITCPVVAVVGDHDSSVSPAGALRIGQLVSTKPSSVYSFRVPTGHLGLCASIKAHTQTWPKVAGLLASL
jgi:polyhydroxyalkanoate synthase